MGVRNRPRGNFKAVVGIDHTNRPREGSEIVMIMMAAEEGMIITGKEEEMRVTTMVTRGTGGTNK